MNMAGCTGLHYAQVIVYAAIGYYGFRSRLVKHLSKVGIEKILRQASGEVILLTVSIIGLGNSNNLKVTSVHTAHYLAKMPVSNTCHRQTKRLIISSKSVYSCQ